MLYVVATPIGNLGDISQRAIDTLRSVDYIIAEDTRVTGKLRAAYEIETPMRSYHMHNEHKVVNGMLEDLAVGQKIALVSDAGMPGISDPGYLIIKSCIDQDIDLTVIPGPVALVNAIVGSGLPTHDFFFVGFLPQKKGRQKRWSQIETIETTLVFYESTHRIEKILKEINERFPKKCVVIAKELTKLHENYLRGTAANLLLMLSEKPSLKKGEFVVLIDTRN